MNLYEVEAAIRLKKYAPLKVPFSTTCFVSNLTQQMEKSIRMIMSEEEIFSSTSVSIALML